MAFDAGSVIAKIKADLTNFQDGLNKVKTGAQSMADKVKGGVETMNNKIKEMTPALQKSALALTAVAAAGTLLLNDWKGAAAGAEVEMARFDATLKATGKSTDAVRESILKAADAVVKKGFDDEEAANAMANFFQRTNDVNEAIKLNGIAMDLARKKNIDLSSAANLVTQVLSGNGKVLKQYGIDIKESATPLEALGQLQEVVAGQTEAFLTTTEGKAAALSQSIGSLKENLGAALLPIMNQVTEAGIRLVGWLNDLSPGMQKAIALTVLAVTAFAAIAAPVLGFIMLIPALTAGLAAVGTALAVIFSPIGLLIGLIAALALAWTTNLFGIQDKTKIFFQMIVDLVAIFKMAWESDWYFIQSIVTTTFTFLTSFFTIWWEAIKVVFQVAMALLKGDWQGAWTAIKNWALNTFATISAGAQLFWDSIKGVFDAGILLLKNAWSGLMEGIKSVASNAWDGVKSVFTSGINFIIDKMNSFIAGLSAATGAVGKAIGQKNWSIPSIPRLAEGGIVRARPGGIIANIGEGGEDEVVAPLSKINGMGGVHIHLHDSVISSAEGATELLDAAIRRVQPRLS